MTVPFRDCYVLVSTNGSAWTSLSDTATVEIVTGTARRQTTSLKPYGYDVAIIVPGRRTPLQLIVTYNYADAAVDETIRAAYEAHSAFYVAFAPRGNATGNFLYTSAAGLITSLPIPEGQRHSGTIVLNRFTFETPGLTKSVIGVT
jgi:hypothetical protein